MRWAIYDLNGNLITQTDGNGNVTAYEYNAAGKSSKKIFTGGRTGVLGSYKYDPARTESYTYNSDGSMKTKKDRNGVTTTYEYNIHGRLLSQKAGEEEIVYTYDSNGNQLTMTDTTGTAVRTYDALNRVVIKYTPAFAATIFTYDITDSGRGVAAGQAAEESKDPKGNVSIKINDKAGRLLKVKDGSDANFTVYEYDGNGNRKQLTYPDGSKEVYAYTNENLLQSLTNKKADGTIIEQYGYTYDKAHDQKTKTDSKGTTSYDYDVLNRLAKVTEDYINNALDTVTAYTYDKAGNRLTEAVTKSGATSTTQYAYNELNRLLTTTVKNGGTRETTRYTYDGNGNMTGKIYEKTTQIDPANPPESHFGMYIPGQGATEYAAPIVQNIAYYEYNVWNQMTKSTTSGGMAESRYNGEGLRVEKTVNGVKTRYLYEYDKVVLELDDNGRECARNVYGINLISRKAGTDKLYYLYNGHADVTALIDNTGTVQASYYYDAFGTPITAYTNENNKSNPIRYAGYQWDGETGLYYLNARYYDSKIARFLSEDTVTGDRNDPLSLNLYTYCQNEPIMYTDPTGHGLLSDIAKAAAEAVAKAAAQKAAEIAAAAKKAAAEAAAKAAAKKAAAEAAAKKAAQDAAAKKAAADAAAKKSTTTPTNILNDIKNVTKDFLAGVGMAGLNAPSFGSADKIIPNPSVNSNIAYQSGKVIGDLGITLVTVGGTIVSGGAAIVTAPTVAGAIACGTAALACGTVAVTSFARTCNDTVVLAETIKGAGQGPYSHLEDPKNVEPGKDFTPAQKDKVIEENRSMNDGVVRSDQSGVEAVKPSKSQKGVTPPENEWQVDHIVPKDKGGTNSYDNAQVLTRKENREKWNK